MKRIFELAIQALTDPDAVLVLGDAVQESGWFDRRALYLLRPHTRPRGHQQRKFRRLSAAPTTEWARAIAAVFLFGSWDWIMWPAAKRCERRMIEWTDFVVTLNGQEFSDVDTNRFSYRQPVTSRKE